MADKNRSVPPTGRLIMEKSPCTPDAPVGEACFLIMLLNGLHCNCASFLQSFATHSHKHWSCILERFSVPCSHSDSSDSQINASLKFSMFVSLVILQESMKFRTMPAMWHAKNIHISYNCGASFFQENSFHRKWNGISHAEDERC